MLLTINIDIIVKYLTTVNFNKFKWLNIKEKINLSVEY